MTKQIGILFRGDMVRGIADGRKHQTRRPVNMETLRVRLPKTVTSDVLLRGQMPTIIAKPGSYRARLNAGGAVTIITKQGELGVKPDEFHFRCPYAAGDTYLDRRWRAPCWMVDVKDTILWVRESFWIAHDQDNYENQPPFDCGVNIAVDDFAQVQYCAHPENPADPDKPGNWYEPDEYPERSWIPWGVGHPHFFSKRPGIHMPRWASRFDLRVTSVRIERLKDISRPDAIAEGAFFTDYGKSEDGRQRAGWSMMTTTSHEDCRLTPELAFADYYNRIHAGERWSASTGPSPWEINPWVWVISFLKIKDVMVKGQAKDQAA